MAHVVEDSLRYRYSARELAASPYWTWSRPSSWRQLRARALDEDTGIVPIFNTVSGLWIYRVPWGSRPLYQLIIIRHVHQKVSWSAPLAFHTHSTSCSSHSLITLTLAQGRGINATLKPQHMVSYNKFSHKSHTWKREHPCLPEQLHWH